MLCKYDSTLNIIDSADFIRRRGENLQAFLRLNSKQAIDIDLFSNIHLIHSSENYLIRTYSPSFELLNELTDTNDHFKPIPDVLTMDDVKTLRKTAGSYSVFYALYATEKYIVSAFYQNAIDWNPPEGPYFFDIYSHDGKKQASGRLPYPFFGKDDKNMLYLFVRQENETWFGDDDYYLVEISIEELLQNLVTKQFVTQRIKKRVG